MKPTQEQVIAWVREAGIEAIYSACDEPNVRYAYEDWDNELERFAALSYEAGRKDENEAIAQMIEDAPPLVDFAKNEHGGCVICGFTPKLAAFTIRERNAP